MPTFRIDAINGVVEANNALDVREERERRVSEK